MNAPTAFMQDFFTQIATLMQLLHLVSCNALFMRGCNAKKTDVFPRFFGNGENVSLPLSKLLYCIDAPQRLRRQFWYFFGPSLSFLSIFYRVVSLFDLLAETFQNFCFVFGIDDTLVSFYMASAEKL